jgi:hypothetical protein
MFWKKWVMFIFKLPFSTKFLCAQGGSNHPQIIKDAPMHPHSTELQRSNGSSSVRTGALERAP